MPANETYPPCCAHPAYDSVVPLYRGIFRVFVNANNFPLQQHDVDVYMMKYNVIEVVIMILLISRAFDIVRSSRIDPDVVQRRYYVFGI